MRWCCRVAPLVGAVMLVSGLSVPGDARGDEHAAAMELPPEFREWFRNPDGSCVQCSNGMVGMHINRPEWTFLLWDTPYGPAVHGGSWPGRVADYAKQRGMRIYNVTGNSFADTRPWKVCNNNSPQRIDEYSEDEFRRLHMASGPWVVVPDEPAPAPPPRVVAWWQ
jgi:hypothetical protein